MLYFNDAPAVGGDNNGDMTDAFNWFSDEACQNPIVATPTSADDVTLLANVRKFTGISCRTITSNGFNLESTASSTSMNVYADGSVFTNCHIGFGIINFTNVPSASGGQTLTLINSYIDTDATVENGNNAILNTTSYNNGTISGFRDGVIFNNNSYNNGTLSGNGFITFNNNSYSKVTVSGTINLSAPGTSALAIVATSLAAFTRIKQSSENPLLPPI